ncbi:D-alanyl-D-alanine carboxypeptidase family protein [Microbacterium sp. CJ88]|uniref:D-alanyl-D-alanine carboxypeptidase family protein n=1 Tax=Microbacterium sp. CJ88 TaxID=3445672 RepID=UPI003F65F7F4
MTQGEIDDDLTELDDMIRSTDGHVPVDDPRRRTRRRWAGGITAFVLVAILATGRGYVAWALNAPLRSPLATVRPPTATAGPPVAIAVPLQGASALSIQGSDAYFSPDIAATWANGGNEPRSIASITKLVTALVVLDAHPLAAGEAGPTLTFGKADHDLYDRYYVEGATIAAMPTGTTMSQRDALAIMLVPSASNYAEAVARWAFGSIGGYADAARRWLDANGLAGTTIVEPTGVSSRNASTPADLLAIARLAAAHPVVAAIAGTSTVQGAEGEPLYNTNALLGTSGITGLKTGNLGEGSFAMLYTATLPSGAGDRIDVTGVILGGATRDSVNTTVVRLLDSIRAGFHTVPVAVRGTPVGTFTTAWGATADLVIGADVELFTWSDTPIAVTMDTRPPQDYTDGEQVGTVTYTAGPHSVSVPLVVQGTIAPPTEWWRLTHPGELG